MMKRIISILLVAVMFFGSQYDVMSVQAGKRQTLEKSISCAGEKLKNTAEEAKKTSKNATDKISQDAYGVSKKAAELSKEASTIADKALSNLGIQADKASQNIKETARKTKNAASKGFATAGAAISEAASKINPKKIKEGWKFTGKLSGTDLAAELGSKQYTEYVDGISDAIEFMRKDLNDSANNSRASAQEKGFVFEKWHADTYNIDAASKQSKNLAKQLKENGKGSVDVRVRTAKGEVKDASMKAMKNSKVSAKAQAVEILSDDYQKYAATAKAKGEEYSLTDYVNHLSLEQANAVIKAEYEGQSRIIPQDQVDNARKYLEGRSKKLDIPSNYTRQQQKIYQETMDSLKDRIKTKDGVQSKPLTDKELQALTEEAKDGNVDLDKYGVKISNYVSRSVLAKQVLSAGLSAAVLQTAIEIGPDLYTIIKESLQSGDISEKKLKELGLNATLSGAGGFVEGSVSQTILIACRAGKFGKTLKSISPDAVGTIAVLTVDAAKYAYMLSKEQITSDDYADLMAEETFVAIAAQASGVALQTMLPMVPFAFVAGSMAGGLLASSGYQIGKTVILEIKDEGGLMAVMPENVTDRYNMSRDFLKQMDFRSNKNKKTTMKNFSVSIIDKGRQIKISQIA